MLALLALFSAHAATITLSANTPRHDTIGTTLQEYTIPVGCRWVQIYMETNAGKLQWTGTDGGSPDSSAHLEIPADTWVEWRIVGTGYGREHATSTLNLYVASDSAGTTTNIQCTTDGD